MKMRAALLTVILIVANVMLMPAAAIEAQPICSPETGFCISNPAFQQYYQLRGEHATLGYPISREFRLDGFRVQFFQRVVLQLQGGTSNASTSWTRGSCR